MCGLDLSFPLRARSGSAVLLRSQAVARRRWTVDLSACEEDGSFSSLFTPPRPECRSGCDRLCRNGRFRCDTLLKKDMFGYMRLVELILFRTRLVKDVCSPKWAAPMVRRASNRLVMEGDDCDRLRRGERTDLWLIGSRDHVLWVDRKKAPTMKLARALCTYNTEKSSKFPTCGTA